MHTIVVAYDETEPSQRALERAVTLAEAFGARLVLTSVAPVTPAVGRTAGAIDRVDSLQVHDEELAHARAYLMERGVEADYVTGVGDPARTIAMVADERHAHLIVLGTREPGLVDRVLRQSVSGSVARRARCDVLIVHP
jgi:nucleotide-binding universal stress UspA family protein